MLVKPGRSYEKSSAHYYIDLNLSDFNLNLHVCVTYYNPLNTERKLNIEMTFKMYWASSEGLIYIPFMSCVQGIVISYDYEF